MIGQYVFINNNQKSFKTLYTNIQPCKLTSITNPMLISKSSKLISIQIVINSVILIIH